tara:strand:- start:123 stop:347 length:225 start_codon:yes stop_codon:yes gene_type:complete
MNKDIKLVVTGQTGSGYNYVTLMIGDTGTSLKDCGALYLSDDELDVLSTSLCTGFRDVSDVSFDVEDSTLVEDY